MQSRFKQNWMIAAGLGAAALAGQTMAQTCTPPATINGADVIVGNITGPTNYNSSGGFEAFSIGTYSCNIGNVWLNWIASTNQHPVIGQNMYKVKQVNGAYRIEQLGQSWLKHGFFALSDNLCCNNCSATDGSHLGVHCADPYTSDRNGFQNSLGPKWQVNAASGVFTYPPANPTWSGSVARRLQVAITDLEPSSASIRYFVEAMYVPADETAANRVNNASHRECSISGSGSAWNMALLGTTQRTKPGIQGWQTVEPTLTIKEVDIPTDGRVILAAKATDLGGGSWHYEYAIQNLNSDRSIQAVSVPVPAGVLVSNIGFHDVSYFWGDGPGNVSYDGTDWAGTAGAGSVSWATQTYAENQSANALRWGTLYNYRFDANTAPQNGDVTMTLFKPGTPTTVTASNVPMPSAPPAHPGDINGDGIVDLADLTALLAAFGSCTGDPNFLAAADFDASGCIDLGDLTFLLANFGS